MICVGLSDILYPGDTLGENSSCERTYCCMCRGHVAFNANDIYVDDIYRYVSLLLQHAIRSQQRSNIVKFTR